MGKRKAKIGLFLSAVLCFSTIGTAFADEGGTEVAPYAYFEESSMTQLTLTDSVISIGTSAYEGSALTKADLPEGLLTIGNRSFAKIETLTEVSLPESLKTIGNAAFYACSSLEAIEIPKGVTQLENSTFYQCRNLSKVLLPEGLTRIGRQVFYDCGNLRKIELPSALTSIEDGAFYACGLTEIVIPEGVVSLGKNCFMDCTELTGIIIPSSVTEFGEDILLNCPNVTVYCEAGSAAEAYAKSYGIPNELQAKPEEAGGTAEPKQSTAAGREKDKSPKAGVRLPYMEAGISMLASGCGCFYFWKKSKEQSGDKKY